MLDNLVESYGAGAAKVARRAMPNPARLDGLGRTQDDFRQELLVLANDAAQTFRGKFGYNLLAESRYVHASMWRRSWNWLRDGRARARYTENMEAPDVGSSLSQDDRLSAAEDLQRLRDALLPEELNELLAVAEAEGGIRSCWNSTKGTESAYIKRIYRLREKARGLLSRD